MTITDPRQLGSGTVVTAGMLATAFWMLMLGRIVGWDPVWRAFGVTPLQPPFFDMHIINDYAACASRGVDPYAPQACNAHNFNIPPVWLLLGFLGIDGSDSIWLSTCLIAAAAIVTILLFRGRSWQQGLLALGAILSPSVMMGIERGNLDLLILALVGAAALVYDEKKSGRMSAAIAFLYAGILLKLIPIFCVSLAARFSRATVIFASIVAVLASIYLILTIDYIFLIRRNVPTTFVLSYGYKVIFLGLDHIRSEAGLSPIGLADTWLPAAVASVVLVAALSIGANSFHKRREFCSVDSSIAGTAFLFGAGIYCGTFILGTNFIYRLIFLLLCVPQLQDWQYRRRERGAEFGLYVTLLSVLWLNGNANGISISLLLPQLLDWLLFAYLTVALTANLLGTAGRPTPK